MKIKNVLVTDGDYLHTVGITRYLGKKDLNVYAIGSDKRPMVAYSKYCKKYFPFPLPFSAEYIPSLENLVRELNIDIIIPIGYQSTLAVAKQKEKLRQLTALEIADAENIELALNKERTYKLAQRIGVPCPHTLFPGDIQDIEDMADQIGYPLIIKGLYEAGRQIVSLVKNKTELHEKYIAMCKENNFKPGSLPMLQEYIAPFSIIEDAHYTACIVYQNGKCRGLFIQHRIRRANKAGGILACGQTNIPTEIHKQLTNYVFKLFDELKWHGAAMAEFRQKNGVLKLLEINPKFWASTELSLVAGVNFPYNLCEIAAGKELNYSEEYNHNLKFHFTLSRDLIRLKWDPKSIPRYILDVINPKVKSNVMLSDLKPNIIELSHTLSSMLLPQKVKTLMKRVLGY